MNDLSKTTPEFNVGDTVALKREPEPSGIIVMIDHDHSIGDVTTCEIVWGVETLEEALSRPATERDIQWTNKLYPLEKHTPSLRG